MKQLDLPIKLPPKRTPLVIAFGNRARTGKNEAAAKIQAVAANYGFNKVLVLSFADALKDLAKKFCGMAKKDAPLLQRLGQHMRGFDPDFWVKPVSSRIDIEKPDLVLIPDMRYENEAAMVKARNGYCVQIQRIDADGNIVVAADRDPKHISEVALDGYAYDYVVRAKSGDVAALHRDIEDVFKAIVKDRYGDAEEAE